MRAVASISRAHMYLKITGYYGEFAAKVIVPFCRAHLCKLGKVPIPGTRGKTMMKVTHVFARSNYDKTEYRLPASLLKEFLEFAQNRGYNPTRIKVYDEPELIGVPCELTLNPNFTNPLEHQHDWIQYQLAPGAIKVNGAAPGQGKTFMSLYTASKMGVRTLITIQPRFLTTWIKAIGDILMVKPEDVLVWEQDLGRLPEAMKHLNPKIIILTMSRIDVYLRNEKKDPDHPDLETIYRSLGCGLRIMDEGHEAIHQIFLSMFYGNFPKFLLLSGTLESEDPFTAKMYRVLLPIEFRLKEPDPENYIDIVAYLYDIDPRKYRLKTQQMGSYNDMTWEDSILSHQVTTDFYFKVANKAYREYYLDVREPLTKCLFFFSRINMCETMTEMFKREYPDYDIESFTGNDTKGKDADKLKYLKHENVVSTPGSCGTGKDIDGLVTVICFHMVGSVQRNKQMIGRLREKVLKMFGNRITPRFVFPMCISQPKHREYYQKRKIQFANKQKTFKTIDSGLVLD